MGRAIVHKIHILNSKAFGFLLQISVKHHIRHLASRLQHRSIRTFQYLQYYHMNTIRSLLTAGRDLFAGVTTLRNGKHPAHLLIPRNSPFLTPIQTSLFPPPYPPHRDPFNPLTPIQTSPFQRLNHSPTPPSPPPSTSRPSTSTSPLPSPNPASAKPPPNPLTPAPPPMSPSSASAVQCSRSSTKSAPSRGRVG